MNLLEVRGLTKQYAGFRLDAVSFDLPPGYIMGFIGRNGAGKTTTIKAMLNLVHRDAGEVTILGRDFFAHELELKASLGLAFGGVDYYPGVPLHRITDAYARFFAAWDWPAYRGYLARFELDDTKKVSQLSAGMKVKYALALALSHHARLLVLDEPTSGLDPISRDDLLDLFREIIEDGERSILFSTQITSDLDKCADYITYIRDGRIVASDTAEAFLDSYRLVKGSAAQLAEVLPVLIGHKSTDLGFTGLIASRDEAGAAGCQLSRPDIEAVMIYCERAGREEEEK